MKEKRVIISFANRNSNYVKSLARLSDSLRDNWSGKFMAWIGEEALGAPPHPVNPYAFKIYAFRAALSAGFTQILWVDSSCFAIKNVQPCFDEIERDGFIFQDSGHYAGNWSSDSVLEYYNLTRDQAMEMKMIGNAGMLGLDFEEELPSTFFKKWEQSMFDNQFLGSWTNNYKSISQDERCFGMRHDMTNSSIIINQMGLFHLAKPKDEWLQYAGVFDPVLNDTIVFKAQGL